MNEVEEIKSKLDLAEVIGGYMPLKQAGRNFKGLSPFKQEKTPSFVVSPDKGIWHDFSSGKGGDVFSFVMEAEGLEFREALEMLARKAGVTLKPRSGSMQKQSQEKPQVYDALELAMKYFHLCLSKDVEAKEYLMKERGFSGETIKRYSLGFSPDSWDKTNTFLVQKGFSHKILKLAGLVAQKQGRDSVYDVFRGRIMFPIYDSQGRVVGFSARILQPDGKSAKYINSPDSLVYRKSNVIYGLFQAKDAIRTQDAVIAVEGNADVVALSQAGYQNVVAISGTALSVEQLKILSRHSKNVLLCFDQDVAGIAATKRAIELSASVDVRLMVVSFEGAKDPDELLKNQPEQWSKAVDSALYAPDYLINYAKKQFGVSSAMGKKQFASFVLPIVASLSDTIEKDHYATTIAQLLGVDEMTIKERLRDQAQESVRNTLTHIQSAEPKKQPESSEAPVLSRQEKIEQSLLEIVLPYKHTRSALHELEPDMLSPRHRDIFVALQNSPKLDALEVGSLLPLSVEYVKILTLRGEEVFSDISEHDARLEAFTQVNRLAKIAREKQKRTLSSAIAEAENNADTDKVANLLAQYQALIKEDN